MERQLPLRVTVLYPDPRILGGVAIFIEALRRSLDSSIRTEPFLVGRRATEKGRFRSMFNPIADAVRLAVHLMRARPDVVHINPSLNVNSLLRDGLFLLVMRLFGMREVLMFMHGWESALSTRISRNSLWRAMFRFVYGWPQVIVVLGSQFRNELLAMGFPAERIRVDSAMFDGSIFHGLVRRPHDDRRLVFVSRLVANKGMWELLDAYASLKSQYPDLSLCFVGDGVERGRLTAAVQARRLEGVTITGFVSAESKAQILLDSDIFVFPTTYGEGCPASLLEAMAAGLPCVTSRVGGIPDVFADNVNGILLDEVTSKSVEGAIGELLNDPSRMNRIANTNRILGWSRFEAGPVSARIAAEYHVAHGDIESRNSAVEG
jgi:glycosyltransferase involved in cell wall biosynthesis